MFRKKYISLEFGEHCIKVGLAALIKDEEFESLNSVVVKTPPSVYGNGKLLDMDNARNLVLETMKQNRFKAAGAVIYISNSFVFRKEFTLMSADDKDIEKLTHREIKQSVPPGFGDFMLQHKVLGSFVDQGTRKTQVFAAAVRKSVISEYLDLAVSLGVTPEVLDLYSEIAENPFGTFQTLDSLSPQKETPIPVKEAAPVVPTKPSVKEPEPVFIPVLPIVEEPAFIPVVETPPVKAVQPVIEEPVFIPVVETPPVKAVQPIIEEPVLIPVVETPPVKAVQPVVEEPVLIPVVETPPVKAVQPIIEEPVFIPVVETPPVKTVQPIIEEPAFIPVVEMPPIIAVKPIIAPPAFTPVIEMPALDASMAVSFKPVFDDPVSKPVGDIPSLKQDPPVPVRSNKTEPAKAEVLGFETLNIEPQKTDHRGSQDQSRGIMSDLDSDEEEQARPQKPPSAAIVKKQQASDAKKAVLLKRKTKQMKKSALGGVGSLLGSRIKDYISLEFGAQNIKIVSGTCKGNNIKVLEAVNVTMPENSFDDGKLENPEQVLEVLRSAIRLQNIKSKNVLVSISSTGAISREIILPTTDEDEMDKIVPFEAKQFLPTDSGDFIVQYKPMETVEERGVSKSKVMAAAMQKVVVESYLNLVRQLGLKPISMDLSPNSMAMLFNQDTLINGTIPIQDKTIAVIDMGHKYLTVNIISNGDLKFSRIIEGGGYDLNVIISDVMGIPVQAAEHMKMKARQLNAKSEFESPDDLFMDSIKMIVDTWAVKIQRIFMFYESRNRGKKISEVFLYGGSASLDSLADNLTNAFSVPVHEINALSTASLPVEYNNTDLKVYMNAIGAIAGNR